MSKQRVDLDYDTGAREVLPGYLARMTATSGLGFCNQRSTFAYAQRMFAIAWEGKLSFKMMVAIRSGRCKRFNRQILIS